MLIYIKQKIRRSGLFAWIQTDAFDPDLSSAIMVAWLKNTVKVVYTCCGGRGNRTPESLDDKPGHAPVYPHSNYYYSIIMFDKIIKIKDIFAKSKNAFHKAFLECGGEPARLACASKSGRQGRRSPSTVKWTCRVSSDGTTSALYSPTLSPQLHYIRLTQNKNTPTKL